MLIKRNQDAVICTQHEYLTIKNPENTRINDTATYLKRPGMNGNKFFTVAKIKIHLQYEHLQAILKVWKDEPS